MPDPTRHPRRGFTTLELLVVIGIILLLMSMIVLGFRQWDKMASTRQTRAQLGVCKNLLVEYERTSGFKYIEGLGPQVQLTNPNPPPPTLLVPVYADPNPPQNSYDTKAKLDLTSTTITTTDMSSHSTGSPRYGSAFVIDTQQVMGILTRVPGSRTIITNMPPNRLLEAAPGATGPSRVDQAVILDGWANPIIFVPAGGLVVNMKDPSNPSGSYIPFVVRSSGTFPLSQLQQHPVTTLDRPFFASAGQDGVFSPATSDPTRTGSAEDNVYSFQQD